MTKVFAVTMCKNEQDIIEHTVRHMLTQVDHVIVADNMSTDNTRAILESLPGDHLTIIDDLDPAYEQSRKMTNLAQAARLLGADAVVPFDADEYWYAPDFPTISEAIAQSENTIFPASMYNFVPTAIDDTSDPNPFTRIQWKRKEGNPLVKVAGLVHGSMVVEMGNHNISYSKQFIHSWNTELLIVRHYPYRSPEQFVRKALQGAAALELTDLPYEMGEHWRSYAAIAKGMGDKALEDVFTEWFWDQDPNENPGMIHSPL